MIKPAILYEGKLKEKFIEIALSDKFKYYTNKCYANYNYEADKDSWSNLEFVSINSKDDIIGYIAFNFTRSDDKITNMEIINFGKTSSVFGRDIIRAFDIVFKTMKIRKIEFTGIEGNPVLKHYNKFAKKIGTLTKSAKLIDGEYYDEHYYEIFRDEYLHIRNTHTTELVV